MYDPPRVYEGDRTAAEAAVIDEPSCEFWRCLGLRSEGLSRLGGGGAIFEFEGTAVDGEVETVGGEANSPAKSSSGVNSGRTRIKMVFIPKIVNKI